MVVAFQCHYNLHFTGETGETSLRETNILWESCLCAHPSLPINKRHSHHITMSR